jgi:hypothetical protein
MTRVISDAFATVSINVTVFCDVTPCRLVGRYLRFKGTCCHRKVGRSTPCQISEASNANTDKWYLWSSSGPPRIYWYNIKIF